MHAGNKKHAHLLEFFLGSNVTDEGVQHVEVEGVARAGRGHRHFKTQRCDLLVPIRGEANTHTITHKAKIFLQFPLK